MKRRDGAGPFLLVSEVFPPKTGGSGRWFFEVYRRLPRAEVLILAGEHPGQEEFDRTHDLTVERGPLEFRDWSITTARGWKTYLGVLARVARIVRGRGARALHAGRLLPEGWVAWLARRLLGVPYAGFVHGEELNIARQSRQLTWMMRRVLGRAEVLIANSRNTAGLLQRDWQVNAERIRVVHPGVDVDRFVPAPRSAAIRAQLGWQDRTVVLTAGRLQKRKGQDRMIEALSTLRQSIPDILYCIVGDGEERGALKALVEERGLEGHVQFRGETSDEELTDCYQQCDLFALPNRTVEGDIEGFGIVLLEAQACGRPVLAGDSGGTAETMRVGETGRVACCDEAADVARAVADMLADRAALDRMGEAARRWAAGHFGWESLSRQVYEILARSPSPVPRGGLAAQYPAECTETHVSR